MSGYTFQVLSRREAFETIRDEFVEALNKIHHDNPLSYADAIDQRIESVACEVALAHGMKCEMVGNDIRFWDDDIKNPKFSDSAVTEEEE